MKIYRFYTLDEQGEPVGTDSVRVWRDWLEIPANRARSMLAQTDDPLDRFFVQTWFDGMMNAYVRADPGVPYMWKTVGWLDGEEWCERQATSLFEALRDHGEVVAALTSVTRAVEDSEQQEPGTRFYNLGDDDE